LATADAAKAECVISSAAPSAATQVRVFMSGVLPFNGGFLALTSTKPPVRRA
jgi:hypothetical protein